MLIDRYINRRKFESYEDFKDNFKLNVPDDFNFAFDIVDKEGMEKPDKRAMIWCNPTGEEKVFTFSDMMKYSAKTANYFKSLGIKKGDYCMVILKRHYQFWFTILALHKIGAVCIPATNLLTTKDIVYRVNAADVKMVVCTGEGDVASHVDESLSQCPTLSVLVMAKGKRERWHDFDESIDKMPDVFERPTGIEAIHNSDPSLLYFTSGTTGYPKMVRQDFTYPLGHLITGAFWHDVTDDGLHFTISDTGWGKAVWGKLYGQWIAETCIMVYDYEKFVPDELMRIIEKNKVTTFCAPPTIYRFLIREDFTKYDLSALRYCTIAGEPLNPEVYNQFMEKTGISLREGFGQTETTLVLATFPWMKACPGSMGKPSPIYEVDLVDDENNSVNDGEVGEIAIRTDKGRPVGMFDGYYKDSERTGAVWYGETYHTGDMAWRDENGYFWYVGRADDVIKSSGYRIGPFEVESALMEHPAVIETAITGVPDEIRGQIVKASVVLAKEYAPSEELKKELQEHVKKVTAPYKYPRIIEFVTELPKTISGKIRRMEIRAKDTEKNK